MMRAFTDWLDRFINRLYPPPFGVMSVLPPADTLAELEADIEVWERNRLYAQPIPAWERELLDFSAINKLAAAILHKHRVVGADIYADAIADAIIDQFTVTRKGGHT